jgi:transposase-like protein
MEMGALQCPRCESQNVININLTMEAGDPVSFYSCHACDKKWWNKDGEPIDLPDVLEMARRAPRRARSKS